MMSEILLLKKPRPFPWTCVSCGEVGVFPLETDYLANVKHDGKTYQVRVENFAIPTCRKCGDRTLSIGDDDRITTALRTQIGLLLPDDIRRARLQLQLSQQELAEQIGVAEDIIARWETGALIQSREMNNLLRLFFKSHGVRELAGSL